MNFDVVFNSINLNRTIEVLAIYTETVFGVILSAGASLKTSLASATRPFVGGSPSSSVPIVEFTELQLTLLKIILSVFLINLILIAVYWRKYGEIITDRFIRPSTLKEIEELKLSVAKLKLPKEHSPRI